MSELSIQMEQQRLAVSRGFSEGIQTMAEAQRRLIEHIKRSGRLPSSCKGYFCSYDLTQGECPIDDKLCPFQDWHKEERHASDN